MEVLEEMLVSMEELVRCGKKMWSSNCIQKFIVCS